MFLCRWKVNSVSVWFESYLKKVDENIHNSLEMLYLHLYLYTKKYLKYMRHASSFALFFSLLFVVWLVFFVMVVVVVIVHVFIWICFYVWQGTSTIEHIHYIKRGKNKHIQASSITKLKLKTLGTIENKF